MKLIKCVKLYNGVLFLGMTLSVFALPAKDAIMESKINALISKMTLEEKIGQMYQAVGNKKLDQLLPMVEKGEVGSFINVEDNQLVNQIQRTAMEKSRLGIPLIIGRDVIHGYNTIFPIPLGQAASFNPEIAKRGARVAAIESSYNGIRWTFAPMIDISRDPRWGRIAESLGEDPYLSSVMGVAMVQGFQGENMSDPTSIAACAKHFFGYGASEGGRDYNSTNIPERLLRNVYLPPFEAVTKAGVATYMTSFNDNDGIPASGNKYMLKNVLRGEWGFDGFVVSDWGAITQMVNHRFCKDDKAAAEKSVNAALDMEMVSTSYKQFVPELVAEKKVDMEVLDEAVRNILRIKFRLGLFDNPYIDLSKPRPSYDPQFLADAQKAAEQSLVLLKNEKNVLPIDTKKIKKIAIIGPLANAKHDQLGTWAMDCDKSHTVTPLMAIREQYGKSIEIIYEPGMKFSRDKSQEGFKAAVDAANKADIVLYFGGEESILTGEAHSMANLNLQGAQYELIAALKATSKPLVFVVMAGRPLIIEKEVTQSDALLYAWHPGTMGGPALADILFGKTSPSGKLPVTFPKMLGQIPIHYNHNMTGRPANRREVLIDDIPLEVRTLTVGCTSYYLDAGFDPLFPFGFGLSYTTFKYENLKIEKSNLLATDTLKVTVELTNSGKFDATEVTQLYVTDLVGSITRPVKELKRFDRIHLKAGETKTVTMNLPISELAFYGIDMKKMVEPGDFQILMGGSSESGLKAKFQVIE